jgi:hypothetical protein
MAGGIVGPSAFAVLRLITSSNFVACWTGRSAGFAPFQDLVYIGGGAAMEICTIRAVAADLPPTSFTTTAARVPAELPPAAINMRDAGQPGHIARLLGRDTSVAKESRHPWVRTSGRG